MIAAKGLHCDIFIRPGEMVINFNVDCGLLIGDAVSRRSLIGNAINWHPLIGYAINPVFPYRCMCALGCVCVCVSVFGAFSIPEF